MNFRKPRNDRAFALRLLLAGLMLLPLGACRLGSNNADKLDALKSGLALDADGNPILIEAAENERIQISAPASGAVINSASDSSGFAASGACQLEGGTVTFKVDGVAVATGACANGSWSVSFDSTPLAQGAHEIVASIQDLREKGDSSERSISKDTIAPSLAVTTPSSPQNIVNSNNSASFALSGACGESGRSISATLDGSATAALSASSCSSGTWTGQLDTTGLSFGAHTVALTHSDAAGNPTTASVVFNRVREASQLAVGARHNCAIVNDGVVECWGYNHVGQLGNNTNSNSFVPVKALGVTGATYVNSGTDGSCAVVAGGKAKCWGGNTNARLGDNTSTNRSVPVEVLDASGTSALTGISQVATGHTHSCALMADQTVECWGLGNSGQLGDNTFTNRNLPAKVKNPAGTGNLTGVTQVAAGIIQTCAVLGSQELVCWGKNDNGELGDNTNTARKVPVYVKNESGTGNLTGVVRVELSTTNYACALLSGGGVRCWGLNTFKNLGDGTTTTSKLPVVVKDSDGTTPLNAVALNYFGSNTPCARVSGGELKCWGWNPYGIRGGASFTGSSFANSVLNSAGSGNLANVLQYGTGSHHGCALMNDNQIRCWGGNPIYQLGMNMPVTQALLSGVTTMRDSDGTTALAGVTDSHANSYQTCVVKNGGVYCWGAENAFGQLGNGTYDGSMYPVQVSGLSTGVLSVRTGNTAACALKADQTVWCWGWNHVGQVGTNGVGRNIAAPVQVVDSAVTGYLTGATQISVGFDNACAIVSGTVFCWGANSKGQHGNNSGTSTTKPVQTVSPTITGVLTGVTQITLGDTHTCAIAAGGAYCWGDNTYGTLGANTAVAAYQFPVAVHGLSTGVTQISATNAHTCALKDDNSVWCWGQNNNGQLGDNSTANRSLPVQVQGLPSGTVHKVVTMSNNACARVDSALYCWGDGNTYKLTSEVPASSTVTRATLIPALSSGVTDVFEGYMRCAVQTGQFKCWGPGTKFRTQTTEHSFLPVQIQDWTP